MQSAVCLVQCAFFGVQFAVLSASYPLCSVQRVIVFVQCTMCNSALFVMTRC